MSDHLACHGGESTMNRKKERWRWLLLCQQAQPRGSRPNEYHVTQAKIKGVMQLLELSLGPSRPRDILYISLGEEAERFPATETYNVNKLGIDSVDRGQVLASLWVPSPRIPQPQP